VSELKPISEYPFLTLKPGREDPVQRRHPWIFSGAVQRVSDDPEPGETVRVLDQHGAFLAWAAYSPASQIRARIWTWTREERVTRELIGKRLEASLRAREALALEGDSRRLVHGESDGLPGLIVDQYNRVLVVQLLSAGVEARREEILELLQDLVDPDSIYERSDAEVRSLEGLDREHGLVRGAPLPEKLVIAESGRRYHVDVVRGHKTGFYLDQRENRSLVQALSAGKQVLDCFCYTGGFSAAALAGGAEAVTGVDASAEALEKARENLALNDLPVERADFIEGDVFQVLRTQRDRARSYDLVILDPPKFAPTSSHAQQAARGYKDINLWAFRLVKPGGILMTFSCSGGIDQAFFQKIVADAALDAGVQGKIIRRLEQGPDHPTALNFPEGSYLKGFLIRVS
jgi:23S rRNA (cytosine1962-C5)-methyltransferase